PKPAQPLGARSRGYHSDVRLFYVRAILRAAGGTGSAESARPKFVRFASETSAEARCSLGVCYGGSPEERALPPRLCLVSARKKNRRVEGTSGAGRPANRRSGPEHSLLRAPRFWRDGAAFLLGDQAPHAGRRRRELSRRHGRPRSR